MKQKERIMETIANELRGEIDKGNGEAAKAIERFDAIMRREGEPNMDLIKPGSTRSDPGIAGSDPARSFWI